MKEIPDHDYDGIKELDNPAPTWWTVSFIAFIVIGLGYYGYYEFGPGHSIRYELAHEMQELELRASARKGMESVDTNQLVALVKDTSAVSLGKGVFASKCVACHGAQAQGVIGPNLTDDYWLHGDGTVGAIYQIVKEGIPEKGMPPWGPILKADELMKVAAYIRSIRGSNPGNAKAPQGELKHE